MRPNTRGLGFPATRRREDVVYNDVFRTIDGNRWKLETALECWVAETQLKLRFSELTRLNTKLSMKQFEISHLKHPSNNTYSICNP